MLKLHHSLVIALIFTAVTQNHHTWPKSHKSNGDHECVIILHGALIKCYNKYSCLRPLLSFHMTRNTRGLFPSRPFISFDNVAKLAADWIFLFWFRLVVPRCLSPAVDKSNCCCMIAGVVCHNFLMSVRLLFYLPVNEQEWPTTTTTTTTTATTTTTTSSATWMNYYTSVDTNTWFNEGQGSDDKSQSCLSTGKSVYITG